jgi:hypothetical protein
MTLVSTLVRDAYRESNLIAASASPTALEEAEGVTVLNQYINSLFGHEAGEELVDSVVNTATYTARSNERVLLSYSADNVLITLPPTADNGARVQIIDTAIGASRLITLVAPGRNIEGEGSTQIIGNAVLMYRADLASWVRLVPLSATDAVPLPVEYEPLLITAIALRINPRHGQAVSEELMAAYERDVTRLKFDFRQTGQADEPRVRSLLNRALKMAKLVPLNAQPRAAELSDALRRLNASIDLAYGFEAGEMLVTAKLGESDPLPINRRLVLDLDMATTVRLHAKPRDGARFAITDVGANLATHNLTVDANGHKIEADRTLVLNTSGLTRQWIYRADIGSWVRLEDVTLTGELPFPEEFDLLFEIETAVRLNPECLTEALLATKRRLINQMRARYKQEEQVGPELGIVRLGGRSRFVDGTEFTLGYLL